MRRAVWLLVIVAISSYFFGCNDKGGNHPQGSKAEQKAQSDNDKALALKYFHGLQDGDKDKMYEAANLTKDIVSESREKLIHPAQNKQTDQQRKDLEHALRVSGNIDFIFAKVSNLLPKSANFQIIQTSAKDETEGVRISDHSIKITYSNKEEAVRDKTGKPVKEMVLHLLQISRSISGRWIHDFSFASKDFERMADRDFIVMLYF